MFEIDFNLKRDYKTFWHFFQFWSERGKIDTEYLFRFSNLSLFFFSENPVIKIRIFESKMGKHKQGRRQDHEIRNPAECFIFEDIFKFYKILILFFSLDFKPSKLNNFFKLLNTNSSHLFRNSASIMYSLWTHECTLIDALKIPSSNVHTFSVQWFCIHLFIIVQKYTLKTYPHICRLTDTHRQTHTRVRAQTYIVFKTYIYI